jgi:hypothetical protein
MKHKIDIRRSDKILRLFVREISEGVAFGLEDSDKE